jgi:hypothetical protein
MPGPPFSAAHFQVGIRRLCSTSPSAVTRPSRVNPSKAPPPLPPPPELELLAAVVVDLKPLLTSPMVTTVVVVAPFELEAACRTHKVWPLMTVPGAEEKVPVQPTLYSPFVTVSGAPTLMPETVMALEMT